MGDCQDTALYRLPAITAPEAETHIAGLLVQVRPGSEPAVAACLAALPRTEVSAAAGGKLVAVCEGDNSGEILDLIAQVRDLPGVLNVTLVYQHAENATAMDEEIGHEIDPP